MKDYFGYVGKVCVVTGASSGMGKSITEMLVDLGAEVYTLSRVPADVPGIKKAFSCDLLKKEDIDNAFAQIPERVDCFFGVAGVSGLYNTKLEVMTVNYVANKYITEEYLTKRVPDTTGAIVYVTSAAGDAWREPAIQQDLMPVLKNAEGTLLSGWDETIAACQAYADASPLDNLYGQSKCAINIYAAFVAPEFGKRQVRVNVLLPMGTSTRMTPEFEKQSPDIPKEVRMKFNGWAGRWAEAREQAEPAVFLNSNMASFLSGVYICGDYGFHLPFEANFAPRRLTLGK